MDFLKPIDALLNYGTLGLLCFLLIGVVVWQQRRYDKLTDKNEEISEQRYQTAVSMKDTYNATIGQQVESDRQIGQQLSQLTQTMSTVAQQTAQLLFRREKS